MVVLRAIVHITTDHIGQTLGDIMEERHSGQFLLDGTKRVNAATELHSLRGMVYGFLRDGTHSTGQSGSHTEPTVVQDLHSHLSGEKEFDIIILFIRVLK